MFTNATRPCSFRGAVPLTVWQMAFVGYLAGLYAAHGPLPACLVVLGLMAWAGRGGAAILIVLSFGLGLWGEMRPPVPALDPSWVKENVRVSGVIDDVSTYPGQRVGMIVRDVRLSDGAALPGRLLWTWDNPPRVPERGQAFEAEFKIRELRGRENFGQSGSQTQWQRKHVWVRTFTKGMFAVRWAADQSVAPAPRTTLMEKIRMFAPEAEHGVIRALLFGDRFWLDPTFMDRIRRAGLSHSLALSGVNLGLAASFGFGLSWLLGALYPALLLRIPRQKLGTLLAIPCVLTYAWMGDWAPSLMRATAMLVVLAGHQLSGRARCVQDSILVATALLVVVDAGAAFDVSLQLSVLAVLGIVLFAPHLECLLAALPKGWTWRSVRVLLMMAGVTLAANAMILPLQAFYFGEFSPHLYLNLLWLPLLDLLVLPLSFAGLFASFLPGGEGVAALCLETAAWGIRLLARGLEMLDQAGWLGVMPVLRPAWVQNVGYWIVLLAGSALLHGKASARGMAFLGCGLLLMVFPALRDRYDLNRNRVELTVLDTGMSQAIMVRLANGYTLLLDGGGSWSQDYDPGRTVVGPALAHEHPPRVDAVLLSHVDTDHLRGLLYILREFDVGWFGWSGLVDETRDSVRLRDELARGKWPIRVLRAGDRIALGPTVWIDILHPGRDEQGPSENDTSLVARLVWQGRGLALLPGDVEKGAMQHILDSGAPLEAQVLVLPHHGSKSSFDPTFFRRVGSDWVVAACGFGNRFGFPHAEVRQFCQEEGVLFTTAEHGAIRFVWREPEHPEIRLGRP